MGTTLLEMKLEAKVSWSWNRRSTGAPFWEKQIEAVYDKSQESRKDWLYCSRCRIRSGLALCFHSSSGGSRSPLSKMHRHMNKGDMWKSQWHPLAERRLVWPLGVCWPISKIHRRGRQRGTLMPDARCQIPNNTWVACGVSYPNNDLNHIDFSAVSRWWGTGKCRVVLVSQPYRAYSV
jgi:hypothetical protein